MDLVILAVILIVVLFMAFIMITEMANFVMTRVPFVPTAKADLEDLLCRVKIGPSDYIYDLGSGNGKVIFFLAEQTGAQAKGLQRAGWAQVYAKLRARLTQSPAQFQSGNFFDHSWSEATVIYTYLYPFLMSQVGEKALRECRQGTRLVVRDFPITDLVPQQTWQTPTNHTMFLYLV